MALRITGAAVLSAPPHAPPQEHQGASVQPKHLLLPQAGTGAGLYESPTRTLPLYPTLLLLMLPGRCCRTWAGPTEIQVSTW